MELLSQCSHALYNREMLEMARRMKSLEKEGSILIVPKVYYENKNEWGDAVSKFTQNVKEYTSRNIQPGTSGYLFVDLDEIQNIVNFYEQELNELTKKQTFIMV